MALCVTDLSRRNRLGLLFRDSVLWQHHLRAAVPLWWLLVLSYTVACHGLGGVACVLHSSLHVWGPDFLSGVGDLPEGIELTSSPWALRTRMSWRRWLSLPGAPMPTLCPSTGTIQSQCGCCHLCEGDGEVVAGGRVAENCVHLCERQYACFP